MHYQTICQHLRERKILVLAKGTFPNALVIGTYHLAPIEPAPSLLETLDYDTICTLWIKALMNSTDVCIDPEAHRLTWIKQVDTACMACRELRDRYFAQEQRPAPHTIDRRPAPEATILPFVRKKLVSQSQ